MKKNRPNILFILTDQHRHDFAGFAGHETVQTPNLDRLAAAGMVFSNAYCQNPLCVPSRSSLLTGKYSRNIGIYENQDILDPDAITFPSLLSQNGYRTCLIGKAHFNGDQYHGYQQRPYGDIFGQAHQPDPRRDSSESGLGGMIKNSGPSGIPLPLTQTEICTAETAKWLQEHTALYPEQPFMLSVNFDKPHFPMRAPEKYLSRYRGRIKPKKIADEQFDRQVPFVKRAAEVFGGFDAETEIRAIEGYCACIEWVDDAIGRILNVLKYLELQENTIVIYSSDHGELAGQYGAWNKTLFFDACNKVPLIISCPGKFSAGRSDELVGLIDICPTLCDIAGIDIPRECDGESVLPILLGNGQMTREAIFSESAFLGAPQYAGCMIRQGRWKYNYYLDGAEELYDMAEDPLELNNLAADINHADLKKALKQRLIDFWEPDMQLARATAIAKVEQHKHCYKYSNQFVTEGGTLFDAKP
jgi:choline-sulfatase